MERIERRALAERQAAAAVLAAGGEVDLPDVEAELRVFDEALTADPEALDPEREELLVAVGLRGAQRG